MIVRYELGNGTDTYASVPARMADQVGNPQVLAWCLLDVLPGAACIEIWVNGRSFRDKPDAVARPPKAENVPSPTELVLDIATAILLASDHADTQTGAPAWLTRGRASVPTRDVLRGRATRKYPPV
ncbi:hypothetical protein [Pseudofrankia asymbiotica]|uniref:Uncharacterized protein n=1 Tax=Pseudofrankia asymbiotica TaxID=1834516 RepID=A0A1V2I3S8_9ACTN|nr:hypothetical protein [Pseudofrankia asymbiotica]ONH24965.1 hypothetical protein BL253_28580 [Pseudofrankia asymbiotica]